MKISYWLHFHASSAIQLVWGGGTAVIKLLYISLSDLFISSSEQNKLSNKMFFEEFPTLVSEYSHACRDLTFIGDFNFHFEASSNGDVDQLKTLLNDHNLVQLVDMPTHKRGHALDWVIVHRDASCLSLETVEDIALSDYSAIYCSVNVGRPTSRKWLVTLCNLRAMNSADFQVDNKSFAETAGDQCADLGLLDVYNTGLHQVLDCHVPLTTRHVSDCPSAPWMTDGIRPLSASWDEQTPVEGHTSDRAPSNEASWRLWWEQWGNFTSVPGLRTVQTPSSSFQCPVGFLASQRPHHSHLTYHVLHSRNRFCMFFSQKIQNIQQDHDTHPSKPATFSPSFRACHRRGDL